MDGDLDTANELAYYFNYPGSRETVPIIKTRTGYAWNHTPVGSAVLWAPFFIIGHLVALRLAASGAPVFPDGYSYPYSLAVANGTHVYCLVGAFLLYGICRRWYSPFASFWAVILIWLASFLPAYLFLYPSMAHALSFFAVCLFLWLWVSMRDKGGTLSFALLGLSAGLMVVVRTQNLLFVIVPLIDGIFWRFERRRIEHAIWAVGCFLAVFSIQAYAWKVTYGSWITIPQGGGFLHFSRPAVLSVLISSRHGLFSWTPALALGVVGLPSFLRKEKALGLALCAVFLMQLYLNSIVDDWWAGTGFGARRFDNCLPALAIGMAALFEWMRGRRLWLLAVVIAAASIVWNGLFLFQYAANWVSHSEAIDMIGMACNQIEAAGAIVSKVRGIIHSFY